MSAGLIFSSNVFRLSSTFSITNCKTSWMELSTMGTSASTWDLKRNRKELRKAI